MTFETILDELSAAIWPSIEQSIDRHGREATSEALVSILGRVLALHRSHPSSPDDGGVGA